MSEINEYVSKANDKLTSSKLLFEWEQYSTSVSASYYSMFLITKALLLKKKLRPKSHEGLISLFGEKYVNEGEFDRDLAKYISRAPSLREDADYDAYDGITKNIAKFWMDKAEEYMEEAKKLL